MEGSDGTDINALCRSHSERMVAMADDFCKVHLFQYPCPKLKVKLSESCSCTKRENLFPPDMLTYLSVLTLIKPTSVSILSSSLCRLQEEQKSLCLFNLTSCFDSASLSSSVFSLSVLSIAVKLSLETRYEEPTTTILGLFRFNQSINQQADLF